VVAADATHRFFAAPPGVPDHDASSMLPEIRMCVATPGTHNRHPSVWLRSVDDAHRLETLLADRSPI
jgi:hypothetical protein